MMLKVFRFNPESRESQYDTFSIPDRPGLTILGALFEAQRDHDPSLAFRYSCRGAVCGTCAMLINRVPRLACRTQVGPLLRGEGSITLSDPPKGDMTIAWDPSQEILVEPLPNLPVMKDLVIDMGPFFAFYRRIEPVLRQSGERPERERPMSPDAARMLEVYTSCILCGACFGACPVNEKNTAYPGPAALAKLYRFHLDPREPADGYRLNLADSPDGWWACEFHDNCRKVCPKGVPPIRAIGKARQEIKRRREAEQDGET